MGSWTDFQRLRGMQNAGFRLEHDGSGAWCVGEMPSRQPLAPWAPRYSQQKIEDGDSHNNGRSDCLPRPRLARGR